MNHLSTSLLLRFLCCCGLLFLTLPLQATHIVGGEMNYRCLGNNTYEISLTVFRDCDTGVPDFDDPARVGIYVGLSNVLFTRFDMPNRQGIGGDTLAITLPDSCLRLSARPCIHTITYVDTIFLPFNPQGYTIAYQRCCRNIDIQNIVNPLDAGATYWTYLTPLALQVCNSSATFNEFPNVYMCSGVPLGIDLSATDRDGDSLVYELCTPSDGDFSATPAPNPAGPPPYLGITWRLPYGQFNMLGNTADPLRINSATGLMEGTPLTTGIFLVGVCIKEYRNGNLISITRRDFQHVVGTCQRISEAAFDTLPVTCNDALTYNFNNTSVLLNAGGYNWIFGNAGTSTQPFPTFTFPDTGQYTVTLIAGIGTPCIDTTEQVVDVQLRAVNLTALPTLTACRGDTITLSVNNLNDRFSDTTIYRWSPDSAILSGQGTNTVQVIATQSIAIGVSALNAFDCRDSSTAFINVQTLDADFAFALPSCDSTLSITFQNQSSSNPPNNTYQWSFGNLGTSAVTNPTFTFPSPGQYDVALIIGGNTLCADTITQLVDVQIEAIDVLPLLDQTYCSGDTFSLQTFNRFAATSTTTYSWNSTNTPLNGQGTTSTTWLADGSYTIQLNAVNNFGCTDSFSLDITTLEVEAAFDTLDLACNISLNIPFVNSSTSNFSPTNYQWTFDNLGTSTDANTTFMFPDTGAYTIQLIAGVGSLCPDTTELALYLPLYGVDLQPITAPTICRGDSVWLNVEDALQAYSSSIQYTWSPSNLLASGQGIDSILVVANATTSIRVSAINSHLCEDSIEVVVTVDTAVAAFDTLDLVCNTSLIVPLVNASTSNFVPLNYAWNIPGVTTSTSQNPIITFPDTGQYTIQLIAGAGALCPDTIAVPIYMPLEGLLLSAPNDTVFCKGDTIELTVGNALDAYTDTVLYSWSPTADIISGQDRDTALAFLQSNQTYTVIGVNSFGCRDTAEALGRILYPSPVLDITSSADSIFLGQRVDFTATDDATYIYTWRTDTTLNSYTIYNPTAKPRQSGFYYLLVQNPLGCTTLDSIEVLLRQPVCGLPVVFIPNAFSPDGDGYNDELLVNGNNITDMTLSIYNRWGERVFVTNNQNAGWDGRYKGAELPPDVYGYYLECVCDDGSTLRTKGNITLLR
jgi:gliding motility-associated-like protein